MSSETKDIDPRLVKAFEIACTNYEPYRHRHNPANDSLWQLISVARRIGFLGPDFCKAHDVSEETVTQWERNSFIPEEKIRGRIRNYFLDQLANMNTPSI